MNLKEKMSRDEMEKTVNKLLEVLRSSADKDGQMCIDDAVVACAFVLAAIGKEVQNGNPSQNESADEIWCKFKKRMDVIMNICMGKEQKKGFFDKIFGA